MCGFLGLQRLEGRYSGMFILVLIGRLLNLFILVFNLVFSTPVALVERGLWRLSS